MKQLYLPLIAMLALCMQHTADAASAKNMAEINKEDADLDTDINRLVEYVHGIPAENLSMMITGDDIRIIGFNFGKFYKAYHNRYGKKLPDKKYKALLTHFTNVSHEL